MNTKIVESIQILTENQKTVWYKNFCSSIQVLQIVLHGIFQLETKQTSEI